MDGRIAIVLGFCPGWKRALLTDCVVRYIFVLIIP
jgi:hypothetical protein